MPIFLFSKEIQTTKTSRVRWLSQYLQSCILKKSIWRLHVYILLLGPVYRVSGCRLNLILNTSIWYRSFKEWPSREVTLLYAQILSETWLSKGDIENKQQCLQGTVTPSHNPMLSYLTSGLIAGFPREEKFSFQLSAYFHHASPPNK